MSALMYSTPKPSAPRFPVPVAWILGKSAGTNTWNVPFWSRRVRKLNFVTRYDPETGDVLPVEKRVGALDRKLRVVCENTEREEDWIEWALYALESVYGYAFAGTP